MLAGVGLSAAAAFVAYHNSDLTARVTLIPRETSTAWVAGLEGEAYRPQQLAPATLMNLMESPELIRRVAGSVVPAMSEAGLRRQVRVEPVHGTELVALMVAGRTPQAVVDVANRYAEEAVRLSRELQVAELSRMNSFCREKLAAMDGELEQLSRERVKFQREAGVADPDADQQAKARKLGELQSREDSLRLEAGLVELQAAALKRELTQHNPVSHRLQAAQNKLADLLTRLTEAHPNVQSQRKEIAELERQLAGAAPVSLSAATFRDDPALSALYLRLVDLQTREVTLQKELEELGRLQQSLQARASGAAELSLSHASLKARLEGLQKSRALLASRQREAQLYEDNAQGYYRVFTPATLPDVSAHSRSTATVLAGVAGLVLGLLGAGLVVGVVDLAGGRVKTVADVERITGLPVLATLGDLNQMSAAEKEAWAFRTWTALAGQLNASPNRGMVCGFISSTDGEGRSTWINLLVNAASQRGLRVLTVSAAPTTGSTTSAEVTTEPSVNKSEEDAEESPLSTQTLTPQVLAPPTESTRKSETSGALPVAHIPLPGWAWNPERRKQWQTALAHWRATDDLVLFIELPPASLPEAVLLAENVPQVIWLADSGKARTRATREQLQTLRHARCRLVGAVLNHEPKPVFEL